LKPAVATNSTSASAMRDIARIEQGASSWTILALEEKKGHAAIVYGKRLPASVGYHGQPSFAPVKLLEGDKPLLLSAEPLIDAAVASSGTVAMLTPSGQLSVWRARQARQVLADDVTTGLSFSADGSKLTFAKGTAPELDIHLAELGSGTPKVRQLTAHPAPDYLATFGADGQRVAFVSTRSGIPALWSVAAAGGSLQQITGLSTDPRSPSQLAKVSAPDGRQPPLWRQGYFVFFDGAGVAVLSERSGALIGHIARAERPHWGVVGREIIIELDGQWRTAVLPASEGAP